MNEGTKITLSVKEQELVCNTEWILTKLRIIEKVYELFGEASSEMQQFVRDEKENLPVAFFITQPKISKGENYQQLPYVMLDYPRYFDKENVLAIRTFFWWGNFISISLQLSGESKISAAKGLMNNFSLLQNEDYWICINNSPWEHHFEKDNYVPLESIKEEEFVIMLKKGMFIKIAKKMPLHQWNSAKAFIEMSFTEIVKLLRKD